MTDGQTVGLLSTWYLLEERARHHTTTDQCYSLSLVLRLFICLFASSFVCKQESPAIADKPTRRESLSKLLQFDVLTTMSLTILVYLHSFSCCCVRNRRNPAKFIENSILWSSRSSKVIGLGVNRKPICDFIFVVNSNFSRIC